ncbi:MAG: tRNA guanosine(15) transglycosylase TgtA [Candidatus Bathyarchaeia archaeon]|nr:tRNA guanosine(15) transglycosylase TgtA [Candidatus Bathyarchaeota archaeon]
MAFEVRDQDLMGRLGRLKTKSGTIETPVFLPVVNPLYQRVSPRRMREEFRCRALITNAYIIKRHYGDEPGLEVHRLLDYEGVVATDSGAYQILVYGGVETTPEEILAYQRRIGSDIAVILDHPTGWRASRRRAEWTVEETLRRAEAALPVIKEDKAIWVGPIQGGKYIDLVERSAKEMAKMPFGIYALGSPTEVMERYMFTVLVDMIVAAKANLPPDRPFHLFGAGHPMMFSLAVALGCDMFDSAAYAIYARDERYLLPYGTARLTDLSYLPCPCPVCRRLTAGELREMARGERIRILTEHNLYVSMAEVDAVKQAISEGSLWELLEARSRSHPALFSALKRLSRYRDLIERRSPTPKGKGIFIFDSGSLSRPQVTRHLRRLIENYWRPPEAHRLLLVKAPRTKPYGRSPQYGRLLKALEELGETSSMHVCFYDAPFGVIPEELSETYPLSQFEATQPLDRETLEFASNQVVRYLEGRGYSQVLLLAGAEELDAMVEERCREVCGRLGVSLSTIRCRDPLGEGGLEGLRRALEEVRDQPEAAH